jgi:hypothetical protein
MPYLGFFFGGVPDNGPISVSAVVPNKPYLIGNPYPLRLMQMRS